jgi:transposase
MRPTAYRRNARGPRDRQAFEAVRLQAGALCAAGHAQAEVARTLGVARQNVSRWHARWPAGGLQALASRGPTGPDPRLSEAQRAAIGQALRQGARAHGFDTDHWTLAGMTTVIQRLTGTRYHPGHTWKRLRGMGWRLQRPARRAVERDEQAIARWVANDWPSELRQRPPPPGGARVLGRVGGLAAAGDASDLGAPRAHPGHRSPLQVEALFDGRRAVLRLPRWRRGARLPPSGRRLRHPDPDRRLGELRRFLGGQKATLWWTGSPPTTAR